MQTDNVKTKEKSVDTSFIQTDEKKSTHPLEIATSPSNDQTNQKSNKEEVKPKNKSSKPALFLDNLSSPSDGGSQKHAEGNQNVLTDRATTKSTNSGYNKKDLNYMLNRDPMKEFFHLTLQSIRMNSPHMNQILNIDCEKFYKKAVEDSIPFNQWAKWLEDQLNRIILSKILQLNLQSKIEGNRLPSIKITKAIENIEKMDKEEVIKMINKKAPATSRHTESKKGGMFSFGFMKNKDKPKVEKKKHTSEFDEILEKPAVVPKTSRHTTAKHFTFDDDKKQK